MESVDPETLHRVLAGSATALMRRDDGDTVEALLTRLCAAASVAVPGADHAGMTMQDRDGVLSSHGVSDPLIAELDRLQADLGEGPCVDAIRSGRESVVRVEDFAAEDSRWPRFAPAARESGVHSLLSFAMVPVNAPPGALNLYATVAGAFVDSARVIAAAFAMQAAIAVYGAGRIEGLTIALTTRDVIGQAKGILMERFALDDQEAFELLVRSSQDTNMKLADVARRLTASGHDATISRRTAGG